MNGQDSFFVQGIFAFKIGLLFTLMPYAGEKSVDCNWRLNLLLCDYVIETNTRTKLYYSVA